MQTDESLRSGQPAAGDPIGALATKMEARADDLADRMIAAYRERVPAYSSATAEMMEDARGWARGSITVATGIVTGRSSPHDFTDALIDVGRRRARQGFPLHDVLMANLIATEILWEAVTELAPEDSTTLVKVQGVFMEASISLLQSAVTALSTGYLEVEHARVADEEHDMQTLVEALAGLREPDRRHEERAEARGIDLKKLRWCAVARIEDESTGDAVRSLRRTLPGAVVGRVGRRVIVFTPGEQAPALDLVPVGIASAEDISGGYRRACGALEVALHLGKDLVLYEEVVPLAMLLAGSDEDREAFIHAQLGALVSDPLGEELLRSLSAYYNSGQSIAAAARALFVHRHTLEYRLQRIETALGRDIRRSDQRLLLELALALRGAGTATDKP